ncbi:unnamed protein product [Thlaspi arvense]|uniref:non-specific serine/threonine protein kinase n=1 Tax=Thlaspi arvense TaxID=13288 RepID=A0AAU9REE1_THLAR|nr:unnamed protein product [Thlaspi arvense]
MILEAFKAVLTTLNKTNIDLNGDPCEVSSSGSEGSTINRWKDIVTCDCSFVDGTICHITNIDLKEENLQGSLPKEFVGLPFLQEIDLSRNYLNGSIPPEWGVLPLVNISLLGNRLTGQIPKEIGNITTLANLVLEANQLSGEIPRELGNLPNIQQIVLSSNNFIGEIPTTFAKLTTLRDFRVSDNQLTGTIPDFIQKWTKLERLHIQASGLVGPILINSAPLIELKDLRVSDIDGPETPFLQLKNMKKMETLILRHCNLTGVLPVYLGKFTSLKLLDLSFNKLSGTIPSTYSNLSNGCYIYLTGNMLNGSIPNWMSFIYEKLPLSKNGLHINCGGDEVSINGKIYETDKYDRLESIYESQNGWFSSNIGVFVDDKIVPDRVTIESNSSELNVVDSSLYMQARLSPISLTYNALCLENGSYNVNLHFAEIMFSGNNTYQSLGRRVFDIYIQRQLVVKDFNIVQEAKGVGIVVVKTFSVEITDGKLEIRLYWAGKGTTVIPKDDVYGPLISAISVNSNINLPPPRRDKSISLHAAAMMVFIFLVALILLLIGILIKRGGSRCKKTPIERSSHEDFRILDPMINSFSLKQIKAATNNFDLANRIGEGGFGPVHKGKLSDGTIIAVKQLSTGSKQGNREFLNEIGMISALHHPNLVKLYGCCVERDQLLKQQPRSSTVEVLREQNNLLELVDPRLGTDYNREEAMIMIQVVILCTSADPSDRPLMSDVVKMLEGKKMVEMERIEEASIHRETKRIENINTMKKYYQMIGNEISTSMSMAMTDDKSSSSEHINRTKAENPNLVGSLRTYLGSSYLAPAEQEQY